MEALSVVGGALLSTAFHWLLTKLESSQLSNLAKHDEQIRLELKNWRSMLLKIRPVLEDAETKQITEPVVKIWFGEVRDLAFDMEDVLDEFPFEVSHDKSIANHGLARTSKVYNVIRTCFTGARQRSFMPDLEISGKIKDITDRLRGISADINVLGLNLVKTAGGQRSNMLVERMPTTSLVEPGHVYGRQNEKEELVQCLLRGKNGHDHGVCVIPIVGMGGIGKTTLVQLVYNDERVMNQFPLKAWVYVSEQLDPFAVTRIILEKVTLSSHDESSDLDSLQARLKEELSGKKFLFILDDVWSESYHQWDLLRRPFLAGADGSKVIITTRHCNVASMMGDVPAYPIQVLPYDDCLSVFAQHALGRKDFRAHPNVKEIGEKIVENCKGLPLAVKTLGGLLRGKRTFDEWNDILNSKLWDLPEEGNDILPALRLSYHHLPSHLKRCFAYCAIFPKGYQFDKGELVFLWMAEGLLLQQPQGNMKPMEDLGHEYFLDLLSRAFFQQASSKESRFMMHDLINDLAQYVAGETCFVLTDKFKHEKSHASFEKVRYLSFTKNNYDTSQRFEMSCKMMSLRAFLSFSSFSYSSRSFLSNNVLHGFLPKLRYLRALSLCDYNFKKLPQSIDELKHLRYLNLSRSAIKSLPESVTSLCYLQSLILHRCSKLTNLPTTLGNLMDLRHLDITQTTALKEMPSGICMLRNLLTLPRFIVGEANGLRIREINGLSHLRGQLSILQLHNVLDAQDARHANLNEKEGLDELKLEWTCDFQNSRNETNEMQVLGWLKPHQNLKKLRISFYGAKEFPLWMGDPIFSNVTNVELYHCQRITSLPSLGQLISLKVLIIKGMVALDTVGFEFYGHCSSSIDAFPSLKILRFEDMLAWEQWSFPFGHEVQGPRLFPCLCELYMFNCPKFVGKLPTSLPSLVKLEICKCPQLTYSFVSLPSLRKLNVEKCNEIIFRSMVHLTCLRTLKITNISHLSCLPNGFKQDMIALEDVKIEECTELTSLWEDRSNTENLVCLRSIVIKNCPLFGPLGREDQNHFVRSHNLEVLELLNCNNLNRLPNESFNISCLRILKIIGCKSLKSLEGIMKMDCGSSSNNMRLEKLKIRHCPSLKSFPRGKLPPTLWVLVIEDCEHLHSLPEGIMSDGNNDTLHLQEVIIINCPSLKSFPKGKFPTSLKTLVIEDCERIQSLPEVLMNDDAKVLHLEDLRLQGFSSNMFFPNGQLAKTLKSLIIFNCSRLETFPDKMLQHTKVLETIEISHCTNLKTLPFHGFNNFPHLRTLVISGCNGLESFPDFGQLFAPSLELMKINRCKNLKSLPNEMHTLKYLKDLKVKSCPSIMSIPERGLPPNLSHLYIDCENLKQPMSEWGLHMLTSLRQLWIHWICPDENVLPNSLNELYIKNATDLESLPGGLLKNLSSLQVLDISRCHKLQSLPKEGLPPSLGSLRIDECPLLQQWCLENRDSRRLIAHIPCLWIG